jgi:hypothetical protein
MVGETILPSVMLVPKLLLLMPPEAMPPGFMGTWVGGKV